MFDRILRVIKLDKTVYAEVEADQMATSQAAIVVAIVAVLSAIAGGIGTLITSNGSGFVLAFFVALVSTFISWVVWSAVTYFVGTTFFHGEATIGEMLRVIGFAQAPLMLNVLSFIPCLGSIISLAAWLFSLYTGFLAIQEGLDLDTGKTIATVAIGWVVAFIVSLVIGMIFGVGMLGAGALSGALGG
jgi:hypothetical protein